MTDTCADFNAGLLIVDMFEVAGLVRWASCLEWSDL